MDCVNHPGVTATAYCQNCGKALCAGCIRQTSAGQVLCDSCSMAWQSVPHPFVAPPSGAPHPTAAAILGLIPGVGAMYNGQFLKGFIHVAIFAVLVSMHDHSGTLGPVFGLFTCAWVFYQVFDAYNTAKARRDGLPLPDPLGLNEVVHNWLNQGKPPYPGYPGAAPGPVSGQGPANQAPGQAPPGYPPAGSWQAPNPYQAQYQQPPYQAPYSGPVPPSPPVPPLHWRRREPIAAVVLIALGVLFLLHQFDIFSGRLLQFTWPVVLIALGAWLIIRRLHDSQGGC